MYFYRCDVISDVDNNSQSLFDLSNSCTGALQSYLKSIQARQNTLNADTAQTEQVVISNAACFWRRLERLRQHLMRNEPQSMRAVSMLLLMTHKRVKFEGNTADLMCFHAMHADMLGERV